MFNKLQIKIINQTIANWRRVLLSAKDDEKIKIEQEIKTLTEVLENDRAERNGNQNR